MQGDRLALDREGGVATITLNQPDRANAIDLAFAVELDEATATLGTDPAVRAVLLRSEGRVFCAGGDVRAFPLDDLPDHLIAVTDALHRAVLRIAELPVPFVAAVQGAAAGAGLGLVLACDLVVAAEPARFLMAYPGVGLSPDAGTSFSLPRRIGELRALELALTNRPLTAVEALEWGVVNRLVAADRLGDESEALVAQLAVGAPAALSGAKRLVRAAGALAAHLADEAATLAASAGEPDAAEGISAFRAKRPPRFGSGDRAGEMLDAVDETGVEPVGFADRP